MRRKLWQVLILMVLATTAGAQPGFFSGMMSGNFWMEPSADAQGYYYAVRYSGDPPEVAGEIFGPMLRITVRQSLGAPGSFFRNQMSQSFPLPQDADPQQMVRQDQPGRVVFMMPRRMPMSPYGPRW